MYEKFLDVEELKHFANGGDVQKVNILDAAVDVTKSDPSMLVLVSVRDSSAKEVISISRLNLSEIF